MRHDNVYLDTSKEIFVLCVLEGTSCILFVTTMDYIIQVYGNALQKYFSGFERSGCVPEGTATQVQSVLLYIFTTHVLLIKLLLWDSWQIPPKHTDTILS